MLGNFQNQSFISLGNFDFEGVQNLGELVLKLNVDDGSNDLSHLTDIEGSRSATVGTDAHYNVSMEQVVQRTGNKNVVENIGEGSDKILCGQTSRQMRL